jgi:ATP-binding cassette subfamily C protein LapB
MLNVKLDHADTTPFRTFKTAFRSVASFYGRPTSDIVLFSGLPDEISESLELDDVYDVDSVAVQF